MFSQTGNFFAQGYEFDIKSPSIALQYPAVSFPYIVDGTCNIHNEFHTPDIPIQVNFTFLEDSEEVVHCMCAKFEKKSNLLFGVRLNTANDLLSALRTYNVHSGSFIFIVFAGWMHIFGTRCLSKS